MIKAIQDMAVKALQGEANPLEVYVELKKIDKALQEAIKSVQGDAISEASKYPNRTFEFNGAKIERKSSAGRWGFEHLKHWVSQKEALKSIEEAAKEAYKVGLKGTIMSDSDGVVIEPAEYVPGSETISVSIPKL